VERTWTDQQKAAIGKREGNCLVSASAGSGKTAVLTERVFELIKEGTKLSELLILTFTDDAASEMRTRIRSKLQELNDPKFDTVIASLDSSNIQTYDAFFLNLVKKYYYKINLPSDIKLVDATVLELAKLKLLDEIFEERFDKRDENLLQLVEEFCVKNYKDLQKDILEIADKMNLLSNKKAYLLNYEKEFLLKDKIEKDFFLYEKSLLEKVSQMKSLLKEMSDPEFSEKLEENCNKILNVSNYDELYKAINDPEKKKMPSLKKGEKEEYPCIESEKKCFVNLLKEIKGNLLFETKDMCVNQVLSGSNYCKTIIDIILDLEDRLAKYKAQYSIYTFADIQDFATQIIKLSDINKEIKESFKYIMIDEYQDTSLSQEEFVKLIQNNNVYVVGDVKQSIYRFRNADCSIFQDKFEKYGLHNGGERIDLPDNFRSRREVVDFNNKVFEKIMNRKDTGIDYSKDHMMKYGNTVFDMMCDKNTSYVAEQINYDPIENKSEAFSEASVIASDIQRRILKGQMVYDSEAKQLRAIGYKDFAILTLTKGEYEIYKKVFADYHIPLFAKSNPKIHQNDLTTIFENIVKLVSLYQQGNINRSFMHPFFSVARSFLFEEKDDKLDELACTEDYSKFTLYDVIVKTVEDIKELNLSNSILKIINNFDIYQKLYKIGDISINTGVLEYYHNIAIQMDQMNFSLIDLDLYFDDLRTREIEPDDNVKSDIKDCVQLMSIHSSKGLQFKFCYFPQIGKGFNLDSSSVKFGFDKNFGILVPNNNFSIPTNFYHYLYKEKEISESVLEELRVFYVALTRPEEKIILLRNKKDLKDFLKRFDQIRNFGEFLDYVNIKVDSYELVAENLKQVREATENNDVVVIKEPINMSSELITRNRASKEVDDVDDELLLLGNKYHYYLELLDFASKDTSFIKNEIDRARINKFVSYGLFKNADSAKVLHEYKFYDEKNNISGIIDMLLIYDDHIDIVDFKLSHVNDAAYEKQVGAYKNYISQISKLPIHTYITGILSGEIKQID